MILDLMTSLSQMELVVVSGCYENSCEIILFGGEINKLGLQGKL